MRPRNVVVTLVLAVLAVLAWMYYEGGPQGAGAKLPPVLPEFTKSEVVKIDVNAHDKHMVFHRRTGRSDAWDVEEGPAMVRADTLAVDDLLTLLARQEVRDRYEIGTMTQEDVTGYEIDATKISVEITAAGKTQLVRYGKRTREGTGVYVDTGPGTPIWNIAGGVPDHVVTLFQKGARSKRLTDFQSYDLGRVGIVRGGVTEFDARRESTQVWRITAPFQGFADPVVFDGWAGKLCNAQVVSWAQIDEPDLKKWGLSPPKAEVHLTEKKGGDPAVILVGEATEGGVYVLEQGRNNVGVAPPDFAQAVQLDPALLRDPSFSRVGNDIVAVKSKVADAAFQLRKEGTLWDITEPQREPADQDAVRALVDGIRSWRTVEFLDHATPDEHGIGEGCDFVELEHYGGKKTTLLLGPDPKLPDGTRYGQRKGPEGDGGVERVEGAVVEDLAKGYVPFKRKDVTNLVTFLGDLQSVARDEGSTDEGSAVTSVVVEKDKDGRWQFSSERGPGQVGVIDPAAVHRLVTTMASLNTREWLFWSAERNAEMGFRDPLGATLAVELEFSGASGTPPVGLKPRLVVGRRRPEGGYFAHFMSDKAWAFVLSEEDLRALAAPLTKEKGAEEKDPGGEREKPPEPKDGDEKK